jgi:hypothetical protein
VSRGLATSRLCQNYHVKGADYSLMETKTLPKLPLYEISLNGVFYVFSGDGHSQTWVTKGIADRQYGQIPATNPAGITENLLEFGRFQQSLLLGKAPDGLCRPGTTCRLFQISRIRLRGGHDPWRGAP